MDTNTDPLRKNIPPFFDLILANLDLPAPRYIIEGMGMKFLLSTLKKFPQWPLVVVNSEVQLLGLIDEKTLLRYCSLLGNQAVDVGDIMYRPTTILSLSDSLEKVYMALLRGKQKWLPVCDGNGRVQSVITSKYFWQYAPKIASLDE